MNDLIYLSLTSLKKYDPYLSTPEYKHNRWFNLPFHNPWHPHINSRTTKLNAPWTKIDTICPIPQITHNETRFDVVLESIAEEFCQQVLQSGKTPYLCWSGGVDSTAILVSLLKVGSLEFLKKLVVLYNTNSINENSYFYYNFIENRLTAEDIDDFKITGENYNKIMIIDGEFGNQIMNHNYCTNLIYSGRYDLLDDPWKTNKELSTLLFNVDNEFSNQLILDSVPHSPVPVETGFDLLWWMNFNFKFDNIVLRKIEPYTHNLTAEQTETFWNEGLVRFFTHPDMQIWSLLTTNQRREGLKITPKYVPKKYIFDFDHNEFWFYNKREEVSRSSKLMVQHHTPYTSSLVAIDKNWNKYYIADSQTRKQLGELLERI